MGWVWGGVLIGVVIVALAVGIPYFMTHRRMREHHDVSDSRYYLRAAEVAVAASGRKREPALVSPGDSKVVIPPLPLWHTRVAAPGPGLSRHWCRPQDRLPSVGRCHLAGSEPPRLNPWPHRYELS
jgi:hypothetical protein